MCRLQLATVASRACIFVANVLAELQVHERSLGHCNEMLDLIRGTSSSPKGDQLVNPEMLLTSLQTLRASSEPSLGDAAEKIRAIERTSLRASVFPSDDPILLESLSLIEQFYSKKATYDESLFLLEKEALALAQRLEKEHMPDASVAQVDESFRGSDASETTEPLADNEPCLRLDQQTDLVHENAAGLEVVHEEHYHLSEQSPILFPPIELQSEVPNKFDGTYSVHCNLLL